ncbi:unnamed protein product [Rotaria magnacalcarata]|uniref:NAD(P)(+)--arginine ADP-ribosyltransferase n=1 Tax=Rotaria magnacalcarata TaxID=392030 RepID=A0A815YNM2_9BILA|nr:unnamed protein product [Rotaria magnacalcarata]CAF1639724.1 unnamed protein product [Rotaria magnacalcarata]CAF2163609.1 unnamed protein product [Rotaria magnacalcarata]CAF3762995.1 unnamed protein product [Rotaria magnacalcarata]CAF3793281.1 unnamed protein product [Rotaria magnacalcarata]
MSHSTSTVGLNFDDVAFEPLKMLMPIEGHEQMPLVSLEKAVEPLTTIVADIQRKAWVAKEKAEESPSKDGLTSDESAAIRLYTMEWVPQNKSLYFALNEFLRWDQPGRHAKLQPFFLYLKLFLTGLSRLPSERRFVYRGVTMDLSSRYANKTKIVWWGFSSCTASLSVLKADAFLGKTGLRTMFTIDSLTGKDIRAYSDHVIEDEVLLLAATQFEVLSYLEAADGLHMIQLKEIVAKFPLLEPVTLPDITHTAKKLPEIDDLRPGISCLIWLDSNANTQEIRDAEQKLAAINNNFKKFTDITQCQKYIEEQPGNDQLVIIVSGRMGREIVPFIWKLPQVISIYVYCMDKEKNKQWSHIYVKVKDVVIELDELIIRIKADHKTQNIMEQPLPTKAIARSVDAVQPKVEAPKAANHQLCIIGEDIQISWKFSGIEKPQVTWFHNDQLLPINSRFQVAETDDGTSKLSIHQAEVADQGIYTARATNSVGETEAKTTLFIIVKPAIKVNIGGSLQALKGETIKLKIIATGTPKPDIVWMKGNDEVTPNDRIQETRQTCNNDEICTLVIMNAEPEDQGEYSAKISNVGDSLISNKCKITVFKLPAFVVKPSTQRVKQGETALFKTQIDGYPVPKISWFLNGKQLKAEEGVQEQFNDVANEGILSIHKVDLEKNAGLITCRLENQHGKQEETVQLNVLAAPIITAKLPHQLETICEQDVSLKVVGRGSPQPVAQWFFNDKLIESKNSSVDEVTREYQLVIKRVTVAQNEGTYRVVLKNDVGEVQSNSCVVTVLEPVVLKKVAPTSNVVDLKYGQKFEITVDVNGKEIPKVQLMKDGEAVNFSIMDKTRYTFSVPSVQLQHQGVYKVTAKNKMSTEEMTVTLKVTGEFVGISQSVVATYTYYIFS